MAQPFLTVNDEPITLGQSLRYLQSSGKLQSFIGEMLRQYILDKELEAQENLNINSASVEQAVINFRLERNLSDPQAFQEWLERNQMSYDSFHQQVEAGFKRETLKLSIVQPQLEAYFQERKSFLDTIILSRIVVADYELAETLHRRLQEEEARFEQLAREYSLTPERNVNGMMGAVSLGSLPENLKPIMTGAALGQIVGPVEIEGRWCIFRVEQLIEASFEDSKLKQKLQNELFERWINEKLKSLTVKMQIAD
ncbi:PPIC-type PPIASE domain protein [Lyngbya aestuarii BL J]|uniref:peptidylprolyl isomerase n=1 Tax=Lyngbya aestuarii BL J TaxID=1348334 RepID=U7QD85_9CYAN|nr:peptidylprolyl isomerase [Lyngbya aestuarii]ERT05834.1 PPIC-type PPIASE domain protein [Lyngbya aestuarii BL J]